MASINDLATAATIASSAVALQSPAKEPSPSLEEPLSPPSPSPSAQLQAQAQEAHAQRTAPASRSPPPRTPVEDLAPSTPGRATASSASSAQDQSSITVNLGVCPAAPKTPTPTPTPTPGPVLVAPQISPQNPAQATIPPQIPPDTASGNEGVSPEKDESMIDVEYESEQRKPPVRGAFIVFEGMDRAGKTTQAKLLQVRCIESGREVKFMRFPGKSHISYHV